MTRLFAVLLLLVGTAAAQIPLGIFDHRPEVFYGTATVRGPRFYPLLSLQYPSSFCCTGCKAKVTVITAHMNCTITIVPPFGNPDFSQQDGDCTKQGNDCDADPCLLECVISASCTVPGYEVAVDTPNGTTRFPLPLAPRAFGPHLAGCGSVVDVIRATIFAVGGNSAIASTLLHCTECKKK
jgi:hypothetical protein